MTERAALSAYDLETWMLGATDTELDRFLELLAEALSIHGDKAKAIRLAQMSDLVGGKK